MSKLPLRPQGEGRCRSAAGPAVAGFRPVGLVLALGAAFGAAGALHAQPVGPTVIHGQAGFVRDGANLTVTTRNGAGSNYSAIDWRSFSVPAGTVTQFNQPSAASTSINRVTGPDPSAIFGTLRSNGRLVLVNPAGIAVGSGAVVDTAGFTASTLRMSDADAIAGRQRFAGGGGPLQVQGRIVAHQGDVVLIAPDVQAGSGAVIESPQGAAILAAGQKVEITGRGLEGIQLQVQAPGDRAVNLGSLSGDAVGIFAGTLRHSGIVQARTATLEGGRVVLRAGQDLQVAAGAVVAADGAAGHAGGAVTLHSGDRTLVEGTLSAQSLPAGGSGQAVAASARGGTIQVLGRRVGLMASARLDASGDAGGGTVLVGGDAHGANATVPNARATLVEGGASLQADARQFGHGGKVVVWSDGATQYDGALSARGGARGGDGGFAETSGKGTLSFGGTADLSAPHGRRGTLLLDPLEIEIGDAADIDGRGDDILGPGDLDNGPGKQKGKHSRIKKDSLAKLLEHNDVVLAATTRITLALGGKGLEKKGKDTTTLTLSAPTVDIENNITAKDGTLNLAIDASDSALLNARYGGGTLTSTSGRLTLGAHAGFDGVTLGGDLALSGGALALSHGLTLADGVTLDLGATAIAAKDKQSITTPGAATVRMAGAGVTLGGKDARFTIGPGITWQGDGAFGGKGTLVNDATMVTGGAGTSLGLFTTDFVNTGTLRLAGGMVQRHADLRNDGTVSGMGAVFLDGFHTLVNRGLLDPGGAGAAGTLAILGNLQTRSGKLRLEQQSTSRFDRITVSGALDLGNAPQLLRADLPGASYRAGDTFAVLSSGSGAISGALPVVPGFTTGMSAGPGSVDLTLAAQAPAAAGRPGSAPAPGAAPSPPPGSGPGPAPGPASGPAPAPGSAPGPAPAPGSAPSPAPAPAPGSAPTPAPAPAPGAGAGAGAGAGSGSAPASGPAPAPSPAQAPAQQQVAGQVVGFSEEFTAATQPQQGADASRDDQDEKKKPAVVVTDNSCKS